MPIFEWTINAGNLATMASMLIAVVFYFSRQDNRINLVQHDVEIIKERQKQLADAFTQITAVLTTMAVQENRINAIEKKLDELSHGLGFIRSKSSR